MELMSLYNLGHTFFNTMMDLADFLGSKPFADIVAVEGAPPVIPIIASFLNNLSIADILFGIGLSTVITIKIVKFFTGK